MNKQVAKELFGDDYHSDLLVLDDDYNAREKNANAMMTLY